VVVPVELVEVLRVRDVEQELKADHWREAGEPCRAGDVAQVVYAS
jgi:hypothetical protein